MIQLQEVTPKNFMEEFDRFNNTILKVINKHVPLTSTTRNKNEFYRHRG